MFCKIDDFCNVFIPNNVHIGAENGENVNLHTIHGGRIRILFDDNAYLTSRDDVRLRISRNTETHLGHKTEYIRFMF